MKQERAQELYSEYAEDTLTPALRQALEQHFDADPAARADYRQFSQVYALLEQPLGQELEAPLGFRAKVLARATEQQGRRETQNAPAAGWLGWFTPPAHRRATGGALAALAVVVAGGILVTRPAQPNPDTTVNGNIIGFSAATAPRGLVQSVDLQPGTSAHLFHLHLPASVPAATVSAYVISATEQITDPAHLADAIPAVTGQHLTNHQGLEIPISPVADPPAGSTLNLLAEYTPDAANQPTGTEVVFTPFGIADPAAAAPSNAGFLDSMQAVASHYGVTVIVDASALPTRPVSADFSGSDPLTPLKAMAVAAGYTVQKTADSTYFVGRG